MIRNLLTVVGLLVPAATVACSANVEDESASQTAPISEAEASATAVIWTQAQDKVVQYIGAEGQVVSHRVGLEIADGSAILRLKSSSSTAFLACAVDLAGSGEQEMNGKYQAYGLSLASAAGLAEQVMVPLAPMPADNEYSSLYQAADVTGTVGPYVFVRETQSGMGCGAAHGGTSVKAFVWDASRGAVAGVASFAPEVVTAKAKAALGAQDNEEVKLAEVIPRYDAGGHLSLAYRFEKSACYACSDGNGNDYSVSTTVEGSEVGAELPYDLKDFAHPPPAVAAYLAANPIGINGWSSIGH